LIIRICVLCRIRYQLIDYEGNRNRPISLHVDAGLGLNLDTAKWDGLVQVMANVRDIRAKIELV
jgi:hypothetical protein